MTLESSDTVTHHPHYSHPPRRTEAAAAGSPAAAAAADAVATTPPPSVGRRGSPLPPLLSTPISPASSLSPATPSLPSLSSAGCGPLPTWHTLETGQKCWTAAAAVGNSAAGGTADSAERNGSLDGGLYRNINDINDIDDNIDSSYYSVGTDGHVCTESSAINHLHDHSHDDARASPDSRDLRDSRDNATSSDDLGGTKRPPDDQVVSDPSLSAAAALSQLLLMPSPPKRPRLEPAAVRTSSAGPTRIHRAITQSANVPKYNGSRTSAVNVPPKLDPHSDLNLSSLDLDPDTVADASPLPKSGACPTPQLGAKMTVSTMFDGCHEGSYVHPPPIKKTLQHGSVPAGCTSGPGVLPDDSSSTAGTLTSWPTEPHTSPSSPLPSPLLPLRDIDIAELLDQDDRPTFLVDLSHAVNFRPGPLEVLFANAALRVERRLFDLLVRSDDLPLPSTASRQEDFVRFKAWVLTFAGDKGRARDLTPPLSFSFPPPSTFAGLRWTCSTLRHRYRVVRGSHNVQGGPFAAGVVSEKTSRPMNALSWPDSATGTALPSPATEVGAALNRYPALGDIDDYFGHVGGMSALTAGAKAEDEAAAAVPEHERRPSFDWTQISLGENLPPHIRFARSVDWSATPLGPIELWPADLRTMANLVMGSPQPAAMYWGPEFTAIYNEAYISIAGQKHPQLMGSSYPVIWAGDIWETVKPAFYSAWHSGQAILKHDDRLIMNRHGSLEETFFNWSIMPLVGADGSVVALYHSAFEITRRKVNQRRMLTLNDVGEKTAKSQTTQAFWRSVCLGLEGNEYDVPFALVYSVAAKDESETGTSPTRTDVSASLPVVLEGTLGVPSDHPAAVAALDVRTSDEGFAPYMRQAMLSMDGRPATVVTTLAPIVLSAKDGSLPTGLLAGLSSQRGFCDACHTVVVFPVLHPAVPSVAADSASTVAGFIVMGTNPRRPYSRDYRLFVHLLARQLTTSLASVVLLEEEVRQAQQAARRAARDRQELAQQLQLCTQQVLESESKFMRMAEFTPVGMFMTDAHGRITYCNDMWWAISRHPRADTGGQAAPVPVLSDGTADDAAWISWMESVYEEDRPGVFVVWQRLVRDKVPVTHEFRFRQKTTVPVDSGSDETTEVTTWVLLRAFPDKDEKTGELKRIFGCITDISQQKLAESIESQRHQEAVEHKRQQENFIDITSHEMRNPLSAILQSVDEITSSIGWFRAHSSDIESEAGPAALGHLFDSILEASNTISLCANHQKHIVDDVRTLSKLDSQLLRVNPVDVQPVVVVRSALKMFETDLNAHDIRCVFRVQPSYQALVGIESHVKLDPSRLSQIIINLMMNAVSFTQTCKKRSIVVSLGASRDGEPAADADIAEYGPAGCDLAYIPGRETRQSPGELTDGADWGTGPKFHLHIAISDTGKGLQDDEKATLFQHFSQASPRTHVQYGGSGLGLFISRYLAELQGGQIGVKSQLNLGSTFAFYIKCRKADATEHPTAAVPSTPFIAYSAGGGGSDDVRGSSLRSIMRTTPTRELSPLPSPTNNGSNTAKASPNPLPPSWLSSSMRSNDQPALDILIVEDNIVNQRVLQRQLNMSGNRTQVANHGQEALDALRRSRFWRANTSSACHDGVHTDEVDMNDAADEPASSPRTSISIILMDLEMPVMDGKTCARAIREMERVGLLVRHVPIIAVTAYARTEQIESAKEAGIDDVISKPFRLAQLMPKIQELVTKYGTA